MHVPLQDFRDVPYGNWADGWIQAAAQTSALAKGTLTDKKEADSGNGQRSTSIQLAWQYGGSTADFIKQVLSVSEVHNRHPIPPFFAFLENFSFLLGGSE